MYVKVSLYIKILCYYILSDVRSDFEIMYSIIRSNTYTNLMQIVPDDLPGVQLPVFDYFLLDNFII